MPEKFPYLSITVVLLTTGESLLPHKDIQNHRLFINITTSFGDWTGGVLQVEENGNWIDHDGKLRNLRLRTWNSSPSPKTDFRACILDNYAYSHESGHLWKIAGFLVSVSVELWYFWEYMGQSWNMWHPTAVVAQVIRQIIPRLFFA